MTSVIIHGLDFIIAQKPIIDFKSQVILQDRKVSSINKLAFCTICNKPKNDQKFIDNKKIEFAQSRKKITDLAARQYCQTISTPRKQQN